jgi:hypothetical protein
VHYIIDENRNKNIYLSRYQVIAMKYEKPLITTYTEEQIAALIGPAQTFNSFWEEELG